MDKEALKKLGLSDAQADGVLKLHTEAISGSYVPKSRMDELNETNKTLKEQLAGRDKDIAALKKGAGDNEALQKQLGELQTKYKTDTEALQGKIKQNALNAALDLGITKAQGKNAKAIKALLDPSKLTLKDDGTVEGLDTALEALRKSDGYLFTVEETHPKGTGYEPGAGGGAPGPETPEAKAVADAFSAAKGL